MKIDAVVVGVAGDEAKFRVEYPYALLGVLKESGAAWTTETITIDRVSDQGKKVNLCQDMPLQKLQELGQQQEGAFIKNEAMWPLTADGASLRCQDNLYLDITIKETVVTTYTLIGITNKNISDNPLIYEEVNVPQGIREKKRDVTPRDQYIAIPVTGLEKFELVYTDGSVCTLDQKSLPTYMRRINDLVLSDTTTLGNNKFGFRDFYIIGLRNVSYWKYTGDKTVDVDMFVVSSVAA